MTTLQIETPRVFAPLLAPSRYKAAHGGRGGGKSHFFAEAIVERLVLDPTARIVCIREVQKSLRQSVKKLIEDKIVKFGVGDLFTVMETEIRTLSGGVIIFQGMQNHTAESIKSLEAFDVAWVEEGQVLSQRSLRLLRPTIRKEGSELWFSWNPGQSSEPVDAFFRGDNPPPDAIIVEVGYEDNPWLPETLKQEYEYDYKNDPDGAAHVWGGGYWSKSDAQVFGGKWRVDEFEPREDWDGPYQGADWGFSKDPTTLVRVWIYNNRLWIECEAHGVGVDLGIPTARLWSRIPYAHQYLIRADNARPESISLMNKLDDPKLEGGRWRVEPVLKWPGSVQDGIAHIRKYEEIIIHPRCKMAQQEARLYRHKEDRLTGDILPDIVDAWNHIWDAVRYALQPIIRTRSWRML
ncbi:hypothetical protein LCGC14_1218850 [marine sediment metagenome]|uniref:Phage terminase large subunit N-terminal domain-containing protein n=1 Tax=marine sediment metagenome TaxID=412755 RepID=A0A0F9PGG3_9ZZZZ